MNAHAHLTEIDGIRLPRIRVGYRKPEPKVFDRNSTAKNRVRIEFPDAKTVYPSKAAAMRALCINEHQLTDVLESGILKELTQ